MNELFNPQGGLLNPQDAMIMSLGSGLLAGSGASRLPRSFGSILGEAGGNALKDYQAAAKTLLDAQNLETTNRLRDAQIQETLAQAKERQIKQLQYEEQQRKLAAWQQHIAANPGIDAKGLLAGAATSGLLNPTEAMNFQSKVMEIGENRSSREAEAQRNRDAAAERAREAASNREAMLRLAAGLRQEQANAPKPMTQVQKQKLSERMSKDFKSTGQVMQTMAEINNAISDIKTSPGLESRVGYSGYIPAVLQGKQAMQAQNRIETLKAKVTQMGKAMASMSGAIGPMAVQEWKIVADAITALDPTADNLDEQLSNVEAQAVGASNRIKDWYERTHEQNVEAFPQFGAENLKIYPSRIMPQDVGMPDMSAIDAEIARRKGLKK